MASAKVAETLACYGHAYTLIQEDPVGGREAMSSLCAQLSRLSPRELDADMEVSLMSFRDSLDFTLLPPRFLW